MQLCLCLTIQLSPVGLYLVCPCRDAPPLYYPASRCSGSLPQKLLIPLFLAAGAAVAGVVPLIEDVFSSIVDRDNMVPHSCIDPTRSVMTSRRIRSRKKLALAQNWSLILK